MAVERHFESINFNFSLFHFFFVKNLQKNHELYFCSWIKDLYFVTEIHTSSVQLESNC